MDELKLQTNWNKELEKQNAEKKVIISRNDLEIQKDIQLSYNAQEAASNYQTTGNLCGEAVFGAWTWEPTGATSWRNAGMARAATFLFVLSCNCRNKNE